MSNTISEVLEFVRENDVQFVRLAFSDLLGQQKNISIMPDQLPEAFQSGVSFDAHAIRGFREVTRSDLLLFPDPGTLAVLPWRPGPGRVARFFCDIRTPDGSPFAQDGRQLLRQAEARCQKLGYHAMVGAECEFYLFRTDEDGQPTTATLDRGGYLDIAPLDKGEDIRREICLSLQEMNLRPEASHHEQGPGQNEIDFQFSDPLSCADNLLTFKSVVKAVAARHGLFASFMPKPIPDAPGSGLHVNLSLSQNGFNIFKAPTQGQPGAAAHFMAGVLARVPEMTVFLNPLVNSYERFGAFEAPKYLTWSHHNRSQLIRIPAATGEKERMELRSPDPALNPYLAFALILSAGMEGIREERPLPPAADLDLYRLDRATADTLTRLPGSLEEAMDLARRSSFAAGVLGEELVAKYLALKEEEAAAAAAGGDRAGFYARRYFPFI